jgi:hypothetical protein
MNRRDFLDWMQRVAIILFLVVAAMVSRCMYPYTVHKERVVNGIIRHG